MDRKNPEEHPLAEALMQGTDHFVAVIDSRGVIVKVSEAAARRAGKSRSSLVGAVAADLFPPGTASQRIAALERVKETGKAERFEDENEGRFFDTTFYPVPDPDGQARNVVLLAWDITDRRRTEEELRSANQKLRNLEKESASLLADIFEKAADGICVCHNITKAPYVEFTHWNRRMADITGYTMDEINELGWYQSMFPDPEYQKRAIERMTRMREGKDICAEEWVVTPRNGQKRTLSISTSVLKREEQAVHVLAVMQDITDRKRVEEVRQSIRGRVDTIQQIARIGDWEWDVETGTVTWSREVYRLFGLEPEKSTPSRDLVRTLVHPEDLGMWEEALRKAVRKLDRLTLDYRALRQDGSVVWIHSEAKILRREDGRAFKVIGTSQDITERKEAEEALKGSEKKFRDLITNMREVLYTLDRDGQITFVSASVFSMTQYRDSEIIGHHLEKFIFRDDLPRLCRNFRDLLSGVGQRDDEYRMVVKSGEIRWIRTRSSPLYEGSEIIGVEGILSDITERKRSEEEVRAARDMLQLIMNNIPQGIFWKDRHSTYLGCNDVFASAVGLESAGSIIGRTDYDLPWSREQAERFREYDLRIMENDAPEYHIIEQQREADGKVAWVETSKVPLHDTQGNVIGILGTYENITGRKRVEEALRESEEKFRSLVETTSDWIWEVDAHGVYTYSSPRVRDLLGYEPEEVLGRRPFEFMPPDESARLKAEFSIIARERRSFCGLENVNIGRDGRRVVLETSGVPRLDAQGNLLGYRGIDRDITDRKLTEEALQRSLDELEFRVAQRTAELERKNRELQEFAFVAAHDLSEPLRKIKTFGSYLWAKKADRLDDEGKNYISRMRDVADRMQELLGALLGYSRLERGQEFRSTRLHDVAREVTGDLEVGIRKIGAQVEVGPLPTVMGDPSQLRQLFQNLIANALKYHRPEVIPRIRIYGEEAKGACRIFVEDNGIGFDEKYLGKIFQPFQRLHGRHEYAGVGIGLAICKKIVERHGGEITAKSTPGKGSTFIVTLPVKGENNQAPFQK